MFSAPVMSNLTSLTEEASCAPFVSLYPLASDIVSPLTDQQPQKIKKKRNLPGNPGNIILLLHILQLVCYPRLIC